MSRAWWGREVLDAPQKEKADPPQIGTADRHAIRQEVAARRLAFLPEWCLLRDGDPATTLLSLFSELAEPIMQRVNRLPEKLYREYLITAGVKPNTAKPSRALLNFTVSDAAPQSAVIPKQFQVSAAGANGSDERVVFETEQTLYAAPGKVEMLVVQEGDTFYEIDHNDDVQAQGELAFGSSPTAGTAFWIGLSSKVSPAPNIAFAVQFANAGMPPTPSALGTQSFSIAGQQPLLRWEFFDAGQTVTAEVIRDETQSFSRSGVVELRCPDKWRSGIPAGLSADSPLRWIRLQLIAGEFDSPPMVAAVTLNTVMATAARTVRGEVLEYVAGSDRRQLRLSQTPVMADSLKLVVNEGAFDSAVSDKSTNENQVWAEVDDLNFAGPTDKVYELAADNGILTFGDGKFGAALPQGFRHVVAEHYQVSSGSASSVASESINGMLSSAPFVNEVNNRLPASGGRDSESTEAASIKGPRQIRARNRCVTTEDYNLLSLDVDGANVLRAHAVAGVHAGQNDAESPGTVSVYLVGEGAEDGPPYPSQQDLAAVTEYLIENLAPAGIEVVAAAPYFHRVGVSASLAIAVGADQVRVLSETLNALDQYFDPLVGGYEGTGWPFGGVIIHNLLVQQILSKVSGLEGIPGLNLTIDGIRLTSCSDFSLRANSLIWTTAHELRPLESSRS